MRILLDESLPRELAALLVGHNVSTVRLEGWSGIKNGRLLALAAGKFDAFLSADRGLEHQQNQAKLPLAVVILVAAANRIEELSPLIADLLQLLEHLPPKTLRKVGA